MSTASSPTKPTAVLSPPSTKRNSRRATSSSSPPSAQASPPAPPSSAGRTDSARFRKRDENLGGRKLDGTDGRGLNQIRFQAPVNVNRGNACAEHALFFGPAGQYRREAGKHSLGALDHRVISLHHTQPALGFFQLWSKVQQAGKFLKVVPAQGLFLNLGRFQHPAGNRH